MSDLFTGIVECWKRRRAAPAPGCSEEEIVAFERCSAVTLPGGVRAFLRFANGMASDEDNEGFYFRPLVRWERASSELMRLGMGSFKQADHIFLFSDYLQWSWAYGLWLHPDSDYGSVWIVGGSPHRRVDASFEGFLEKYAQDDNSLYGCE